MVKGGRVGVTRPPKFHGLQYWRYIPKRVYSRRIQTEVFKKIPMKMHMLHRHEWCQGLPWKIFLKERYLTMRGSCLCFYYEKHGDELVVE